MKKLKLLSIFIIMTVIMIFDSNNNVQAYRSITSQELFESSTFDTLNLDYRTLPDISATGSTPYSIDNNAELGRRYVNFTNSANQALNITVTAKFNNCGTLNGREIDMKLVYSDIVTSGENAYLYWTAFGNNMMSSNEWWYDKVEHMKIEIYFYFHGENTPIQLKNAFLSIYSVDKDEGASSTTSVEEFIYTETNIGHENSYNSSITNRTYNDVFYGIVSGATEAGSLNCVAFQYKNTDHLTVELYGFNAKEGGVGYHLQYTPLTATIPVDPVKEVDKTESELGDKIKYTVEQKMSTRFDNDFYYSSLVFTDTLNSNLIYDSLKVYNDNGEDITSSAGKVTYSTSTNVVTYTFDASYLQNTMKYTGEMYKFEINATVKNSSNENPILNSARTTINGVYNLDSNTVSTTLKSKVIVHHVNRLGVKIADDVEIDGNLLDTYNTDQVNVYGYKYYSDSGNTSGTMTENVTEVTYTYDLIRVDIDLDKTIEKTDSTPKQALKDAKFRVKVVEFPEKVALANPDEEYFSVEEGEDGHYVIKGVPYGNYKFSEVNIPDIAYDGVFYLDESKDRIKDFDIEVNEDKTYSYSLEDVAKKMQITIYKEDIETGTTTQGDAHLEGAKYGLYRDEDCTDLVEEVTIQKYDLGGGNYEYKAVSGWYLVGIYYVKETVPPEGYNIDPKVYTVNQIPADQIEEQSYHNITSKDEVIRNDIEITKYLEETDSTEKQNLAGAVFTATLNSDETKNYASTPTDSNGNCVIKDLPYGTYTVRETTVPDKAYNGEFYLNNERVSTFEQFIQVDSDTNEPYKYADVTDVAKKMQITIYKEDKDTGTNVQGDAHLEGAKYGLYRDEDCTDLVEEVTIQKNDLGEGNYEYKAVSGWYLVGKYYIKETQAPEGYLIDETVYPVEQVPAEQTEERSSHSITSKDEVMKGLISLIKYNNNSGSSTKNSAEGAVLRLTLDSNPEVHYEATVNKYGYLEFVDENTRDKYYPYTIPYGVYTITEIQASDSGENIFIQPQKTEIRYNEQTQEYILSDEYVRLRLTIQKQDGETSKPIPEGAKFKIWNVRTQSYYEDVTTSGRITEFTTNKDGQITINGHLEAGNYVLYETKAPEGYYLDENLREGSIGYEFTVSVNKKGEVVVRHNGEEKVLEYDEEIYQNIPSIIHKYTANVDNIPQKAVVEVEKLADQFTKVNAKDTEYGKLNTPVFEKVGLRGVEFQLIAAEDITTPDGTVRYHEGEVVSSMITGENGVAKSDEIYLGKYKLKEISTVSGYILDTQEQEINIEYTNDKEKVQTIHVEKVNEKQKVKLSFEKIFKELETSRFRFDGMKAVFGIYTKNSISNYENENILGEDELVDIMTTNENNIVENTVELPEGEYYVKELYVSNPYGKLTDEFEFTVEYKNTNDENIALTINDGKIENVARIAQLRLLKFSDEDYKRLNIENIKSKEELVELSEIYGVEGASYKVYNDEKCEDPVMTIDNLEAEFTTDENGQIYINDMPYGTYYFKESKSPFGYKLANEVIKVEINDQNANTEIVEVVVDNLKRAKLLQKRDTFTKDIIAGVEFEITDEKDNIVYSGTTDENGFFTVPTIYFENGAKYYYQEKSASKLYDIDTEKHEFVARYDEEKCEWTLALIGVGNNRKTIDELIVRKTDRETGELLEGCKFTIVLLDENGEEYINENGEKIYLVVDGITNENGEYIVKDVPYGTYKFVEITPPEGYELDEDITGLVFTVDENTGDTLIFEVTNTGDIAVIALVCVAIVSVLGIVYVVLKNKKKNNK